MICLHLCRWRRHCNLTRHPTKVQHIHNAKASLVTFLVPLLSVHIDWSTSTLSPITTGKLELLEIAEATANFRKSIEPYSSTEGAKALSLEKHITNRLKT